MLQSIPVGDHDWHVWEWYAFRAQRLASFLIYEETIHATRRD